MAAAESPAALFELLYIFFPPHKRLRIAYDNGCNFLSYALNRDPLWAASVRVFIDELHSKGHKQCAAGFNTGVVALKLISSSCLHRQRVEVVAHRHAWFDGQ
jgi:hypothetical protein